MITVDLRPSRFESAYVEKPFNEAVTELENAGFDIISLKQFAELRIAQGKDSHVSENGAYVREGFLYVPRKGVFLVRNSPILGYSEEATRYNRQGRKFSLTPEVLKIFLGKIGDNSIQIKNLKPIPTNRFGEDERTVFAFGDCAQKYGDFLHNAGIGKMSILLNIEEKETLPFARQVYLNRLSGFGSAISDGWDLHLSNEVRGIKDISKILGGRK